MRCGSHWRVGSASAAAGPTRLTLHRSVPLLLGSRPQSSATAALLLGSLASPQEGPALDEGPPPHPPLLPRSPNVGGNGIPPQDGERPLVWESSPSPGREQVGDAGQGGDTQVHSVARGREAGVPMCLDQGFKRMAVRHAPDLELIIDAAKFFQRKTKLHTCSGRKNAIGVTVSHVTCEPFLCDLPSQGLFSFMYFVSIFI